jgi:hypothetical protein
MPDPTEHAWIAWLGERDAHVLLPALVEAISEGADGNALGQLVDGWHTNALQALHAEDWRAPVDRYLEVWADARLAPERER